VFFFSKSNMAIVIGNEMDVIFTHPMGVLYGFFGQNVHHVHHGVLSPNITAKVMSQTQRPNNLFPTPTYKFDYVRISIIGRTLTRVMPKFSQPSFAKCFKLLNAESSFTPRTMYNLQHFFGKYICHKRLTQKKMRQNNYKDNWYWHINFQQLVDLNGPKMSSFKLKKGLKFPTSAFLRYILRLALTPRGQAWNGSIKEGALFVWTKQAEKVKQQYKVEITSTCHGAAETSKTNEWYLWLFIEEEQQSDDEQSEDNDRDDSCDSDVDENNKDDSDDIDEEQYQPEHEPQTDTTKIFVCKGRFIIHKIVTDETDKKKKFAFLKKRQ